MRLFYIAVLILLLFAIDLLVSGGAMFRALYGYGSGLVRALDGY